MDEFDFDRAASAFPDISLDGEGDVPAFSSAAAPVNSGFSFDDFGSPPRASFTEVKVTGDEEIEKFEGQFPDIDPVSPPPVVTSRPTFGAAPPFAPRPQPSAYSATPILNQQLDADEPEPIRLWRETQAEEIRARDDASKAKRQETIGKAERAIDQFYEEYAAKKADSIRANKCVHWNTSSPYDPSLTKGTTWERICDIIELQNSQSKTIARTGPGTTDLSRFKEVLLRLKREGDAAPGAAGY
ncbi:clathrin light chain [Pisolithus orientalis]|uniref:clathrin light chain n=1 Tax=Pisolithus orientalis TaxID=936130 RepID=UPI0022241A92|nr:clathrin light chain [Pisolithus orientalis]KAI6007570.1 clathrin light chain [Pisolithus orientalis]